MPLAARHRERRRRKSRSAPSPPSARESTAPARARSWRRARRARRPRSPGRAPRAKPAISVMSVVGTTFGIGEKATRPATEIAASAATRATICEGRPRALVPGEAAEQRQPEHRHDARLPAHPVPPAAGAAAPPGRGSTPAPRAETPSSTVTAAPSRMRATSLEKYQPPESSSRGRSVGGHLAARRAGSPGRRRWRRTRRRGWRSSPRPRDPRAPARAPRARPSARGPCPASARRGAVPPAGPRRCVPARDHDREGETLALAAGEIARVGLGHIVEAEAAQCLGSVLPAQLFADRSRARRGRPAAGEHRDLTRGVDPSALRLDEARRRPEQGALARSVAPHQGDPLSGGQLHLYAPERLGPLLARAQLHPDVPKTERRASPSARAAMLAPAVWALAAQRPRAIARLARRASAGPGGRLRGPGARSRP